MNITPDTKIIDILELYPWLRDVLPKLDSKFSVMNTFPGKLMIRKMTIRDAAKKAGVTPEKAITRINKIINGNY